MSLSRTSTNANVEINGAALREMRQLRGLFIKDLADNVRCSAAHISFLENEQRACSPGLFGRICDALRIPEADRHILRRRPAPAQARSAA